MRHEFLHVLGFHHSHQNLALFGLPHSSHGIIELRIMVCLFGRHRIWVKRQQGVVDLGSRGFGVRDHASFCWIPDRGGRVSLPNSARSWAVIFEVRDRVGA